MRLAHTDHRGASDRVQDVLKLLRAALPRSSWDRPRKFLSRAKATSPSSAAAAVATSFDCCVVKRRLESDANSIRFSSSSSITNQNNSFALGSGRADSLGEDVGERMPVQGFQTRPVEKERRPWLVRPVDAEKAMPSFSLGVTSLENHPIGPLRRGCRTKHPSTVLAMFAVRASATRWTKLIADSSVCGSTNSIRKSWTPGEVLVINTRRSRSPMTVRSSVEKVGNSSQDSAVAEMSHALRLETTLGDVVGAGEMNRDLNGP